MQLTRFDRWLREKFAYETHIQTLRLPDQIPPGIKVVDLPDIPGKRYKHLLIARKTKDAEALIAILRENSQMYSTQIIERDTWLAKIAAPEEKSLTWWSISWIIILTGSFYAIMYVVGLLRDPEMQENLKGAIEILKG